MSWTVISPRGNDSFQEDLSFTCDVIFFIFFQRKISEMRGPTGVKLCTVVSTRPYFITLVQSFGAFPQKL